MQGTKKSSTPLFRIFHKKGRDEDRRIYVEKRKSYKELIREKKKLHKQGILSVLNNCQKDAKLFWGTFKSCLAKDSTPNTISVQGWFDHFRHVFCTQTDTGAAAVLPASVVSNADSGESFVVPNDEGIVRVSTGLVDVNTAPEVTLSTLSPHVSADGGDVANVVNCVATECVGSVADGTECVLSVPEDGAVALSTADVVSTDDVCVLDVVCQSSTAADSNAAVSQDLDVVYDDILDSDFSAEEVKTAIRALHNGKAAGPDGVIGEFFKHSEACSVTFLTNYFNALFRTGTFPTAWTEAIIQPLHKKGDINNADNYRGISLLSISSKLYTFILNKRLSKWIELNGVIGEFQAGFRKKYSTIDHIFTLSALVQKQLVNHKKLFVAFIDFKKAFDSVVRAKLWDVLKARGVKRRMFRALQSIYHVVKARVRVGGGGELTIFLLSMRFKAGRKLQSCPFLPVYKRTHRRSASKR